MRALHSKSVKKTTERERVGERERERLSENRVGACLTLNQQFKVNGPTLNQDHEVLRTAAASIAAYKRCKSSVECMDAQGYLSND